MGCSSTKSLACHHNGNTKSILAIQRKFLRMQLLALPSSLRKYADKASYPIVGPITWGYQIDSLHKYMGAGIVWHSNGQSVEKVAGLQFTTLFIPLQATPPPTKSTTRILQNVANFVATKKCAEFVTSVDTTLKQFIIEKAFLHDVCPTGQNCGARAIAEHIYAPIPEGGVMDVGGLLQISETHEVKLSSVVNWNTYAVMSTALGGEEAFDEAFKDIVNKELRMAKVTRADCRELQLSQILMRTCLGKLLKHIFQLWFQKSGVLLECVVVKVKKRLEEYEYIAGSPRNAMDIICQVHVSGEPITVIKDDGTCYFADDAKSPLESPMAKWAGKAETAAAAFTEWLRSLSPTVLETAITQKRALLDISGFLAHTTSPTSGTFRLGQSLQLSHEVGRPLLLAVSHAIHELQRERGVSCMAVAESRGLSRRQVSLGRDDHDSTFSYDAAVAESTGLSRRQVSPGCDDRDSNFSYDATVMLKERRLASDIALAGVLHESLLHQGERDVGSSLGQSRGGVNVIGGAAGTGVHSISTLLVLLRAEVDAQIGGQLPWQELFDTLCQRPGSFNALIGSLLEWLALNANTHVEGPVAESLAILCYFKEQLGQMRGFVLCRGRPVDERTDNKGLKELALRSGARALIGDLLQSHEQFSATLQHLRKVEAKLQDTDSYDPIVWYNTITPVIDACQELVEELLSGSSMSSELGQQGHSFLAISFRNHFQDFRTVSVS